MLQDTHTHIILRQLSFMPKKQCKMKNNADKFSSIYISRDESEKKGLKYKYIG